MTKNVFSFSFFSPPPQKNKKNLSTTSPKHQKNKKGKTYRRVDRHVELERPLAVEPKVVQVGLRLDVVPDAEELARGRVDLRVRREGVAHRRLRRRRFLVFVALLLLLFAAARRRELAEPADGLDDAVAGDAQGVGEVPLVEGQQPPRVEDERGVGRAVAVGRVLRAQQPAGAPDEQVEGREPAAVVAKVGEERHAGAALLRQPRGPDPAVAVGDLGARVPDADGVDVPGAVEPVVVAGEAGGR